MVAHIGSWHPMRATTMPIFGKTIIDGPTGEPHNFNHLSRTLTILYTVDGSYPNLGESFMIQFALIDLFYILCLYYFALIIYIIPKFLL